MQPPDSGRHSIGANLRLRVVSGFAIAGVAAVAFALGPPFFTLFCAIAGGLLLYELAGLSDASLSENRRISIGIGGFLACLIADYGSCALLLSNTEACLAHKSSAPSGVANAYLAMLALVSALTFSVGVSSGKSVFAVFGFIVLLGAFFLMQIRFFGDVHLALWLILVVVATDVAGYFGGKAFGGPKLAPSISPRKTWSGAISGWASAALVGFAFATFFQVASVWAALAASAASQLGDLAESWLKRRANVKDSSSLIPGHGGVLDRFDGLAAASAVALVLQSLGLL